MVTAETSRDLSVLRASLTGIAGRILQLPDRKAAVILGTGTKLVVGTAAATTATGIVGTLGTASTGAAIGGLSGAAKATATLYWIGGLVGGGVAAGSVVVGAGAVGIGIYGSIKARRAIFGAARPEHTLSEQEMRFLETIQALTASIQAALESSGNVSARELVLFWRIGVAPLLDDIDEGLAAGTFGSLKTYQRIRLRGHVNNLRARFRKLEAP